MPVHRGSDAKGPFYQWGGHGTKYRYTAGEFDLFDGRRLYINRGLGYLKRIRFNARPEITVFTLRPTTLSPEE